MIIVSRRKIHIFSWVSRTNAMLEFFSSPNYSEFIVFVKVMVYRAEMFFKRGSFIMG